jgi:putative ABC transport system permease protein
LLFGDIRHALRMMRRTTLFTAAVILTVRLAIGATTTIFSVVNAVLLRPLPFREPSRLVQVAENSDKLNLAMFTIVGVVGDVRSTALTEEFPSLHYPAASRVWPLMDILVRTNGSPAPEALLPAIPEKVREPVSELALANARTMEQWLSNSAAQPRLNTVMLSVFAFVALLIASVGMYGVLAYSVSQRTGEIGVRMALGATPRDALRLIIREGVTVVLIGIGAGLLGGLALGRAVSSLVFGVPVRDPAVIIGVAATLATVVLAACTIPAARGSRVDPIVALRYE